MNVVAEEPVLTAAGVAAAIIAIAAIFGVVLDTDTVETICAAVLPIILAVAARWQVTPTAKL
jgi:hypothetical protein